MVSETLDLNAVNFSNPEPSQLDLIIKWFKSPHVSEFWDHPETGRTVPDLRNSLAGKPHLMTHWLGYYNEQPFAYFVTTKVEKNINDSEPVWQKWRDTKGATYSLDMFIGEEAFLGKGMAHLIIRKLIQDKFPNATAFLIDPETRNVRAIHVYEKAGFKRVEVFKCSSGQFKGVPCLMMKLQLK